MLELLLVINRLSLPHNHLAHPVTKATDDATVQRAQESRTEVDMGSGVFAFFSELKACTHSKWLLSLM